MEGSRTLRTNRDAGELGGSNPPPSAPRQLEEVCPNCGYPTIEEVFDYNGEALAVNVCINPKDDYYNWIVPKAEQGEDGDNLTSEPWADSHAEQMKLAFLKTCPVFKINLTVSPTQSDVDEYCKTRYSYHGIISHFLVWFKAKKEKE